jgi:quinol monooxygenase YgiN
VRQLEADGLAVTLAGHNKAVAVTRRARPADGVRIHERTRTMILIVQHTVRDYDAWKPVFDEHESVRAKYGCLGHTIYRDADKPNDLTLFMRYESRERADEFMRDPSLAEAMQRGGVISEPSATWLEEAEVASYASRRAA